MKVKNVSGSTATFVFGRTSCVTLANNATAIVPSTPEVVADATRLQAAGDIAIVEAESGAEVVQVQPSPQHVLVKLGDMVGSGDGKYLTLSTAVFEFDSNATYTAGRTPVTIHGSDQLNTGNSLKTAINANAVLAALGVVATDVLKVSTTEVYVVVLVPIAITLSSFTATASASPLVATKVDEVLNNAQRVFCRQFTAAGTSLHVATGLTAIRAYLVVVRDVDGGFKAYDGNIVVSGGSIRLTNEGTPGVALANTDIVSVVAVGE